MDDSQFRGMPLDELWELHTRLSQILTERLVEERTKLRERLSKIKPPQQRTYPEVQYYNPNNPSETWVGHGRRPRWVSELLSTGKRLEDFRGIYGKSGSS